MNAYIKVILILLILTETRADLTKLVNRLYDKEWPWFGVRYAKRCPKAEANWPKCYNPRDDIKIDVLKRIGIQSLQPAFELEVIFSAPSETADVCGKSITLPEVKPFKLNAHGFPITDLLKKGAEIYRRMPIVKWNESLTEGHSLLFIDSGFVKVRGYIGNIRTNGTHLLGEILWPYTPPANPVPYRNPIVILMLKEDVQVSIYNQQQMFNRQCIVRGIDKNKLRDCLGYLADFMGAAKVKAVQVFYTDGSSLYEKSRACQEGSFCDQECIKNYKTYVTEKASSVEFMTVPASDINMYVNLDVMSVRRFNYTACCNFVVVEPYMFRAVPGDNNMVDDTAKLHQPHRVEFSGSGEAALDVGKYYSVLIVDPDAIYPNAKKLPYGHLWKANLKYQDHYSTGSELINYAGPTPPDHREHTYHVLLFSHQTAVEAVPSGFYQSTPECDKRCMWDLSKLPSDFHLRGITWFRAKTDNFTLQFLAGPGPCSGGPGPGPGLPPPGLPPPGMPPPGMPPPGLPPPGMPPPGFPPPAFNCQPHIVAYEDVPKLAISLTYVGDLMQNADPRNPDFDYDLSAPAAGNVLGGSKTLWLTVFCVRVLVDFHV